MREQKKVYFIRAGKTDRVKIGCALSVGKRMRVLQVGGPDPLEVIFVIPRGSLQLETSLPQRFAKSRILGEWFRYEPEISSFLETRKAELREDRLEKEAEIYWELKQQEYEDRIEKEAEEYFESREREYWALKELEKEADAEENG